MIFICISLIANDIDHLFLCLLVILYIFSDKVAFQISCLVLKWGFFLLLNFESSLKILHTSPLSGDFKILSKRSLQFAALFS